MGLVMFPVHLQTMNAEFGIYANDLGITALGSSATDACMSSCEVLLIWIMSVFGSFATYCCGIRNLRKQTEKNRVRCIDDGRLHVEL